MKADKEVKRCGTQITLQVLTVLHFGKLGSVSKTFEVLSIVKIILASLSFKDLAGGVQRILMNFSS